MRDVLRYLADCRYIWMWGLLSGIAYAAVFGLYGIRCLSVLPRTPHDKSRGVKLKRKFEPPFIRKYYQRGGTLYE